MLKISIPYLILICSAITPITLWGETYVFIGFNWSPDELNWENGHFPDPLHGRASDTVIITSEPTTLVRSAISGVKFDGTIVISGDDGPLRFNEEVEAKNLVLHRHSIFEYLTCGTISNYATLVIRKSAKTDYLLNIPGSETHLQAGADLLISYEMTHEGNMRCNGCEFLTLRGFGSDPHSNRGSIDAPILLKFNATLVNYGTITNDITINGGSTFVNENTVDANLDLHIKSGATFVNQSTIGPNVNLRIDPGATVINHGTLDTYFYMSEGATVTNYGVITEWAFLENHASLINLGTLECDVDIPLHATLTNNGDIDGTTHLLGTLKGSGTLNVLNASRDSRILPGNSIGAIEVLSSISNSGMTLEVEVDGANGSSDLLDITSTNGQLSLVYLDVVFLSPPSIGDRYLLIDGVTSIGIQATVPPSSTQRYEVIHDEEEDQLILEVSSLLPVELVSFSAQAVDEAVELQWQTASEIDNHGFYIQRSGDGLLDWEDIAFVEGQRTIDSIQRYTYTDQHPMEERSYYRLRQVDLDGQEDFSPIIEVQRRTAPTPRIYPNLLDAHAQLLFVEGAEGSELTMVNLKGQVVLRQEIDGHLNSVDLSAQKPGIYLIAIEAKGRRSVERLIVK